MKKSKESKIIKFRIKEGSDLRKYIKEDGTLDFDAMTPEDKKLVALMFSDFRKNMKAEFGDAPDDGEDLNDLAIDRYDEKFEDPLKDWRDIPTTYDANDVYVENLKHRSPVTLKEYRHWEEYGDGYSTGFDFDDTEEDSPYYGISDEDDEYVDSLDFYGDEPLENDDFYDEDEELDSEFDSGESFIDDSSVIYPEDDDADDDFLVEETPRHPFHEAGRRSKYTSAEVLMYFQTKADRDKAFSILLDHDEDVYKCDAHYTPAFPGSEAKGAIERALVIYAELYGSYDVAKKDIIGKDKAGEDIVVPVKHTQYVGMDEEIQEFVEDMESLLPVKVIDYEYRGVIEESSRRKSRRLREGGDIAYIFDEEGFKRSGIYDELTMSYGKKIADIFLDWVKSPEYKNGRFVITYEWGPESATISASDLMDFDMARYYAELFTEYNGTRGIKFGGYPGSFMSSSYMNRALVKIESTKDDVRFIGKSGPMNHLNGDISMFEDDEL